MAGLVVVVASRLRGMKRADLLRRVSDRVGDRSLVFVGTRGDDAEGLADVPQLSGVYSLIASIRSRSRIRSVALEDLTGQRVDLDTFDIDQNLADEAVIELRREVLGSLTRDSVVVTYRPSLFLSSICFASQAHCEYAGLFHAEQAAFEHKPFVESALRAEGVQGIPWVYVADEDQPDALAILDRGPAVLRRSRSTGGTGLVQIESPSELGNAWPVERESFVSVAPFVKGVPTNVSGVVWRDGGITLHCPSVQLVGVEHLTQRPFGYCGNDFGAVRNLEPAAVREMERIALVVGRWLSSKGFLGAFGVDFLVDGPTALFVELNPRLQGVTHLACQWASATERSCVLLEHLAASLGLSAPEAEPLESQLSEVDHMAHLVVHRLPESEPFDPARLVSSLVDCDGVDRVDVRWRPGVELLVGATVARASLTMDATINGFTLVPEVETLVRTARSHVEGR